MQQRIPLRRSLREIGSRRTRKQLDDGANLSPIAVFLRNHSQNRLDLQLLGIREILLHALRRQRCQQC